VNNAVYADKILLGPSAADKTTTIGGETTNATAAADLFSCFAILGEPTTPALFKPCFIGLGDSLMFGFNENNGLSSDGVGNTGLLERYLANSNNADAGFGFIKLGVPSTRASQWRGIASGSYPRTLAAIRDVGTHLFLALGRNDLSASGVTIFGYLTEISDFFQSRGFDVTGSTVTPKTTSTDSWATLASQTIDSTDAERVALNTLLRTTLPASMSRLIDAADSAESSRNSGKWKVTGAANAYTDDGLHCRLAGLTAEVPLLPDRTSFFGL
jgi:hypothetical protein